MRAAEGIRPPKGPSCEPLHLSLRPGNVPRHGHDPRPPRADKSRDRRPVAPVTFLEPGPPRTTPAAQRRRADQDEGTLRPLRTPFTADVPGDR